jgi:hypothetical protein
MNQFNIFILQKSFRIAVIGHIELFAVLFGAFSIDIANSRNFQVVAVGGDLLNVHDTSGAAEPPNTYSDFFLHDCLPFPGIIKFPVKNGFFVVTRFDLSYNCFILI